MELWRLSRFSSLTGIGGLCLDGRWHTAGRPIVYLAETVPGAILEVLVHLLEDGTIPPDYKLLRLTVPDANASAGLLESIHPDQLSTGWRDDLTVTRQIGDHWLAGRRTALLRIPSVVAPATFNVLLNPLHPDASLVQISEALPFTWDPRLQAMNRP